MLFHISCRIILPAKTAAQLVGRHVTACALSKTCDSSNLIIPAILFTGPLWK